MEAAAYVLWIGGWIVVVYVVVLAFRMLPRVEAGEGPFTALRREWLAIFRWPWVAICYVSAAVAVVLVSPWLEWGYDVIPFVTPILGTPLVVALSGAEGALRHQSWRPAVLGITVSLLSLPVIYVVGIQSQQAYSQSRLDSSRR